MKDIFREKGTQKSELIHGIRFAVRVRTHVDEYAMTTIFFGDITRCAWTDDSRDGLDTVDGTNHHGAAASCACKCVDILVFEHPEPHCNARIRLVNQGFGWLLIHFDEIR